MHPLFIVPFIKIRTDFHSGSSLFWSCPPLLREDPDQAQGIPFKKYEKMWEEMKAVTKTKMIQDEKICEVQKRE